MIQAIEEEYERVDAGRVVGSCSTATSSLLYCRGDDVVLSNLDRGTSLFGRLECNACMWSPTGVP
jgi:hypothetical protein